MMNWKLPIDFSLPVMTVDRCFACEICGEPVCPDCLMHYADCPHPGPHSDPSDNDPEDA